MTTRSLTCDEFDALLPDLVDGTLDAIVRASAEAHAESCARCRGLLADLVEIRADASRLPTLKASRDLWDGIAPRLAPRPAVQHVVRNVRYSPVRLAAAAVLLVVATASVTWTVAINQQPVAAPVATATLPDVTPSARVAVAYDADLATLGTLVSELTATLDSTTAQQVADNLRTIDDAILQVRAALDANPNNMLLSRQLAFAYQRKVSTLRRVAELMTE
ncbi:MAG TPA: zf-HC2 domain-containing protein [Gemmatimonadaceae bacterium]|nr:zf-HC2 domain-containing protein [Gemmatimonadaceae bacterium]